jgi:hypothetical protein
MIYLCRMKRHVGMRPQDIAILLKIVVLGESKWFGKDLSLALHISASEVSESLQRSHFAGLIDSTKQIVRRQALLDFLVHGLRYVFPVHPGALVRGVPTAFSATPLAALIQSKEAVVWPHPAGNLRGQSVEPLYPNAPEAALADTRLHELLALTDALRIGRAREREAAVLELQKRILNSEPMH